MVAGKPNGDDVGVDVGSVGAVPGNGGRKKLFAICARTSGSKGAAE